MTTVTIGVASLDATLRAAAAAMGGEPQGAAIMFESVEQLFATMTPNRWALVRAMAGRAPMAIRAAARLVDKDVKNVHGDVQALLDAGVLDRCDGKIVFPYASIHVDFMIDTAA